MSDKSTFAQRVDEFWEAFAQQASAFTKDQSKIIPWAIEHVDILHNELSWEFVPWTPGKMNLTITCESRIELIPLVDEVIRKAPPIEGWTFSTTRPPVPSNMVANVFKSRTGNLLPSCMVSCPPADLNFIDIEFDFSSASRKISLEHLFVLLEIILGEQFLRVWIGDIRFANKFLGGIFAPKRQKVPLEELRAHCDKIKAEILEGSTPNSFYFEHPEPTTGGLFTLKRSVYASSPERSTIATVYPQVMKATLAERFWSERYSRFDEIFCYLKINEEYDAIKRGEIQDKLDDLLREQRMGCVLGGGFGHGSSFIDLVLADVQKSKPLIKEFMTTLNISCKLHFFDLGYRGITQSV